MRRHCLSSRRGGPAVWLTQLLCALRALCFYSHFGELTLFGSSVHTMRSVLIRTNRVLQSSS
jgi:hypothetical protein